MKGALDEIVKISRESQEWLKRDDYESFDLFTIQKAREYIEPLTIGLDVDIEQVLDYLKFSIPPTTKFEFAKTKFPASVAHFTTHEGDYQTLGGLLSTKLHNERTPKKFSQAVEILYHNVDRRKDKEDYWNPIISNEIYKMLYGEGEESDKLRERLDKVVEEYDADANDMSHFGFLTLFKSYLLRVFVDTDEKKIVERPSYLFMRVALGIHGKDIEDAIETFEMLCKKNVMHATPTLFNAGTPKAQMSSCFLLQIQDDSIEGIYDTLKQCAVISKHSGGVGFCVTNIRARGSTIRGSNGESAGLVPMLLPYDLTAKYVDQGGGKRNGSFAAYLEPWHSDIEEFLHAKPAKGQTDGKCKNLFFGLWIPDLFMECVKEDLEWKMFCPDECPGLLGIYGDEFTEMYNYYSRKKKEKKTIRARKLWNMILESQAETGAPYMMYRDSCNAKSNQQNLGYIQCSNLCTEIVEYTSPDEVAVCNLASVCLHKLVTPDKKFNFAMLAKITRMLTRNLNKIIDRNYYPVAVPQTKFSNLKHRPIGLGVQGLADLFYKLGLPYESDEAILLNKQIFACMYYNAMWQSNELAKISKKPYETFEGSPLSQGKFQFDLWIETGHPEVKDQIIHSLPDGSILDWETLRIDVVEHGVVNSLLMAPMPTASTSQIAGGSETTQPHVSNVYSRNTLTGTHQIVNSHLIKDLNKLGLWNDSMRQRIIYENGSIANIEVIPPEIRERYKTIFELGKYAIIDMAADRGIYICQSQSVNFFVKGLDDLSDCHIYAYNRGLKGSYYARFMPKVRRLQNSIDERMISKTISDDSKMSLRLNSVSVAETGSPTESRKRSREEEESDVAKIPKLDNDEYRKRSRDEDEENIPSHKKLMMEQNEFDPNAVCEISYDEFGKKILTCCQ